MGGNILPDPIARTAQTLLIENLALSIKIGVGADERAEPQRLLVNLWIEVEGQVPQKDEVDEVVDYGSIVRGLRQIAAQTSLKLLETLAERMRHVIFADPRVRSCRLQLKKPDIFPDAEAVGVEISYTRTFS